MRWSWKIAEISGIGVYMHATFLLLIGWVALSYWLQENTIVSVVTGVGFILALFVCVVLHEFGHAFAARKYGIKTRDITLLPIGGVARLERMPEKPTQELWVALAGPAVNVVIAGVLFVVLMLFAAFQPISELSVTRGSMLERLMIVNVFLAGFNLIPAFPMDGGRVLRALLAMRMEYTSATQLAATIGQGVALVLGFVGLFSNPFLVFIAFFVWIGAANENRMVQMKSALQGIPVSRAMLTEFHIISPQDTLQRVTELIMGGSQQEFPVVENDQVVGILTRADLLKALSQNGQSGNVADVMQRDFVTADSYDMLDVVFKRLETCGCHTMPVVRDEKLVGLITMENVGEFLSIQAALRGSA